ncbi:hypothetical protein HK405_014510 [Cladochytrium tenue]|nr:hypothetical protein HK405_014510 [Cladochytrium tenue]
MTAKPDTPAKPSGTAGAAFASLPGHTAAAAAEPTHDREDRDSEDENAPAPRDHPSSDVATKPPSLRRSLAAAALAALSPWSTLAGLVRSACFRVLARTRVGRIRIVDAVPGRPPAFAPRVFGPRPGTSTASDAAVAAAERCRPAITVRSDTFWLRLALYNATGFGEAYMYGEVVVEDLAGLLLVGASQFYFVCRVLTRGFVFLHGTRVHTQLFVLNREYFSEMNLLPAGLNRLIDSAIHSPIPNTIYNSLYNIQAHYDLGNEMFAAFLDPSMTYSCPIWDTANPDADTLEQAQYRKIHAILDRAHIRPGHHVLEIGTGWGALAIEAVRRHDCSVTSLTLSEEQKALADERIAQAGLSHRITVLLRDYRDLDPAEYRFDRIVTVEMLEAVGPEFLPVFFRQADALLLPGGVLALQVITMPDARYKAYVARTDFIKKHIFPGGHCPSASALVEAAFRGSQGRLVPDELVNIGPHYAKALRLWRERFLERFDGVVADTGLAHIYTPEFRRKWEFYFAYCEAGFASRTLGDVQMRFTKEANLDLIGNIPM